MNRQDAKKRQKGKERNGRISKGCFLFLLSSSFCSWRLGGLFCEGSWLLLAALTMGCRPAATTVSPPEPPWFADITEESGLNFVHDPGPLGHYFLPEVMGSGAAIFDFDGDGRPDLYLLQNGGPDSLSKNRLFRQEAAGRFTDVSAGSGLDIAGYNMGVAIGDVNNDGWPDVLVTQYGGIRLFLNRGDGTFTDITRSAGLDNPFWGTSACFLDYDRDGWLDLVVVNYVNYNPARECTHRGQIDYCHPRSFVGTAAKLYRNRGRVVAQGSAVGFENVTAKSGLDRLPGKSLGVVGVDLTGDGWPDIFAANDAMPNFLWVNQHDGTFREEAVGRGLALNAMGQPQGNMGIALGDVDGDGLLDLFVTHLTSEIHTLWRQTAPGLFQDQTGPARLAETQWHGTGFGTVFGDFDHDGALDLALVNGRVYASEEKIADPALGSFWSRYAERNQLFANDGTGHFRDISAANATFCGTARVSRGLACGDIDGDGGLDFLVTTIGGPARLYRNVAPKQGHWLLLRLIDPALRRDAYGARVRVQAGERRLVGIVSPAQSYLCSCDPRVHFGLGQTTRVDTIEVDWPDGSQEIFPGVAVDGFLLLRKGEGKPVTKGEPE
jgi:enediyne biosynthesis protein E4